MEQQDDPEARIRELERSLTDEARASEMGAQPYADPTTQQPYTSPTTPPPYTRPPPPPIPSYGAPFPMSTGGGSTGFGKAWLVLAMFVVGMLVLAGGIAFFALRNFSTTGPIVGSPSNRTSAPARGSFTDRPSSGRGASSSEPTAPSSATETAPAGGEFTIQGVSMKRTVACNDGIITVMGVSNTVALTGHCGSLTVLGSQNVVTVDSADTISASGLSNKVTYHSGTPAIDKSGSGNVVEHG